MRGSRKLTAETRSAVGRRLNAWIEFVERDSSPTQELRAALREAFLMKDSDSDAQLLAKFRELGEWTRGLDEHTEVSAFGSLPRDDRALLTALASREGKAVEEVVSRGTIRSPREYRLLVDHADALAQAGSDAGRLTRVNELLAAFDAAPLRRRSTEDRG